MQFFFQESVDYGHYCDCFGRSRRRFQDDLKTLRGLGEGRFSISPRLKGGRAFMSFPNGARSFDPSSNNRRAMQALAHIAAALGGPLESELRSTASAGTVCDGWNFLHVAVPKPSSETHVKAVFEVLKAAAANHARTCFRYRSGRSETTQRRVEPYHVVARNGRYYLIGYDVIRRGWRYFALDAIGTKIVRDGTFAPRNVPERYSSTRSVGWMNAPGQETTEVTFRISPRIAATVEARTWADGQRIAVLIDGSLEITLAFSDLAEAVRWALQFAPEAQIVDPPAAAMLLRETALQVANSHTGTPAQSRAG